MAWIVGQNLFHCKPDRQMCRIYLNKINEVGVYLDGFGYAKKSSSMRKR
ncbi:MAG: hypothetical protein GY899_10955 [Verrucomicrobiaceae bacterium]|nr:hypothetical protein [Verrucomicrobiaceae bacterium]